MSFEKESLILKHLGFLKDNYGFCFCHQTFNRYHGFEGPIETYSFYNPHGCFTLHNIVQKGEWGWYYSKNFSLKQEELLEQEIDQSLYVSQRNMFTNYNIWKLLAQSIKQQISVSGSVFGIKVDL